MKDDWQETTRQFDWDTKNNIETNKMNEHTKVYSFANGIGFS